MMATNDNYFDIETSDTQNEPDSDSGTKPKVFKDGQYTDPLFKKLSRINGEVNKLSKSELQGKLKELGLDPRGLKEVLRKRLKNYHRKKNMKKAKININGKTAYDYLAVIDFEATCDENNPSYRHEIIEFPIVLIDVDKMEIVDKFHEYVKPLVNPKLTPFCTKLTGITQDQVDGANIFPDVLSNVNTWLQDHHLGSQKSFAVLTDGPWDMFRFMYYQCKESKIEMPIWSKKWVNIRKAYCNFYQCGRGGIEIMLKNLGMTFEGSPHSGIDDSVNIARIAIKMLNDGCALTMNEKLVVKTNAHDSSTSVRYEPYKDTGLSPEQEEEEKRRKKEKRKERLEMEQKMSNLSVNDVEWTEDDDLDDLLNYYKLQKS